MTDWGDRYEPTDDPERLTRREVRHKMEDLRTLASDYRDLLAENSKGVSSEISKLYHEFDAVIEEASKTYEREGLEEAVQEYAPQLNMIENQMEKVLTFDVSDAGSQHHKWEERTVEQMIEEFENRKARLRYVAESHDRMSSDAKDFGGGSSTIRDCIEDENYLFRLGSASYTQMIQKLETVRRAKRELPDLLEEQESFYEPEENEWSVEAVSEDLGLDEDAEGLEDITGSVDREPSNVEDL